MEFLKCKACGSIGMVPMDVKLLDQTQADDDSIEFPDYLADALGEADNAAGDQEDGTSEESRFYSCHVCGDNWLSIRRQDTDGENRVTFIHQMGVEPVLRRVAHLQRTSVVNEKTVDHWEYYLDEDEVAEHEWMDKLEDRRRVLKAICSN